MPTFANDSGTNKPLKNLYVKQAGVWLPVQRSSIKRNGAWVSTYDAEVKVTLSSETTNLDVQSLYSVEDWANTYKKKILVIPSGVVVGATSTSLAALNTGSGRGGLLEIVVDGEVLGAGGATTGAAGGAAINIEQSGVTVYVNGAVRGGGGAGGKGGTGGGGSYTTTARQPTSGQYQDTGTTSITRSKTGSYTWRWSGTTVATGSNASYTVGSYTYYKGTRYGGDMYSETDYYGIYRTYPSTTNTSGGAGGNGGRGQGYDGALAAGAAGAAGGTNAGKGGTGGTGGIWGAVGATGATGANGNRTNGTAGAAGGAAGAAITGVARTVVNTGTINGSY